MRVEEVMSERMVSVPLDGTLAEAGALMAEHGVESVLVVRDGSPVGVLSADAALGVAAEVEKPLSDIPVHRAATRTIHTVAPGESVRKAADKLVRAGTTRLVVVDGIDPVGVVTTADIVRHQKRLLRDATRASEERDEWES